MTTDPGDLVLDPTCGSGPTAFVAEQWDRRWISIDTSRVALAIARQRLMTARFENYRVKASHSIVARSHSIRPGNIRDPASRWGFIPNDFDQARTAGEGGQFGIGG